MDSLYVTGALPPVGFPIRKSPGQSLFSGSPKLIAVYHVLHRLSLPRHPPYALSSLTIKNRNQSTRILHSCLNFTTIHYAIVKEQLLSRHSKLRPYKTFGGGERVRTDDPLRARQVLSQLSYTPKLLRRSNGGPGWTRTSDLTIISRVL